jgi:hypothetical protein
VDADHVLRLLFSDAAAGDVHFPGERWTGVLEPLNDLASFDEPICIAMNVSPTGAMSGCRLRQIRVTPSRQRLAASAI